MIAIIRIKGKIGLKKEIDETLNRLNLRKKYSCVLINENDKIKQGMLKKVRNFVAYGKIEDDVLKELIEKRGKSLEGKKVDSKKVLEEIKKGKSLKEAGLNPVFRLHPARKGINTKQQFTQGGILGNNKEKINDLIKKML